MSGPAETASYLITVAGVNFGIDGASDVSFTLGSSSCTVATHTSDAEVICAHVDGVGVAKDIVVDVGGQPDTLSAAFTYDAPDVTAVEPFEGELQGGYDLTIFGSNFGPGTETPAIAVGGTTCTSPSLVSDTELVCTMPSGIKLDRPVSVNVGTQDAVEDVSFDYFGEWHVGGSSHEERRFHTAALLDRTLYVAGGELAEDSGLRAYDIIDETWRNVVPASLMPVGRYDSCMVAVGGQLYMYGGVQHDLGETIDNRVFAFDPATEDWTEVHNGVGGPGPRFGHACTAIDRAVGGQFVLVGGNSAPGTSEMDVWVYSTDTNTWAEETGTTGGPPSDRVFHGLAFAGGLVYMYGGLTGAGASDELWSYDVDSNTWDDETPVGLKPAARFDTSVAPTLDGSGLIMYGGNYGPLGSDFDPQRDLWHFDIVLGTWTLVTASDATDARARAGHSLTTHGHSFYLFGGTDPFEPLTSSQRESVYEFSWGPNVLSVLPNSVPYYSGEDVTIYGKRFPAGSVGCRFSEADGRMVDTPGVFYNDTIFVCNAPAAPPTSRWAIGVTLDGDLYWQTDLQDLKYETARVYSIVPSVHKRDDPETVTVTGVGQLWCLLDV